LTSSGQISFSTFLGGSATEHVGGIAIDSGANVYVAGSTSSANFPVLNAYKGGLTGGQNAFVTKVSSSGGNFVYSTYLGGNGGTVATPEQANGIAVDSSGNAYVAGVTSSTNFPTTASALRRSANGLQDAFVAELGSAGNNLVFGTYLGGTTSNAANAIAVDRLGNIYVAGMTSSLDFPLVSQTQLFGGAYDAFIAILNPGGSSLSFSTYFGGTGSESANALAIDSNLNIYLAGQTTSANLGVTAAYQSVYPGLPTGWILRLASNLYIAPPPVPSLSSPANGTTGVSSPATINWTASAGATSYDVYLGTSSPPAFVANVSGTSYSASSLVPGQKYYWQVVAKNSNGTNASPIWAFTMKPRVPVAAFRDTGGAIRTTTFPSPTLSNAGGTFTGDPSVAEDNLGNAWVAVRDAGNALWANKYTVSSGIWSGWASAGGNIQGIPAIAVDTSANGWIGVRDSYNGYWLVPYSAGKTGTWTNLGGSFVTDPVMASCGDGSLYLIGKDSYSALWSGHYIPGVGFRGWISGGGVVKGKPAAACGSDNALYIAIEDNYNSNWVARVSANTWTGWFLGGAVTSITPRIVSLGNGVEAIVILDTSNAVWRTTFTEGTGNGWQPWVQVGGILLDVAAAGSGGTLYLSGRSPDGGLWWWQQTGSVWTSLGSNGVDAGAISAAPR
jgi:hypothetical protein